METLDLVAREEYNELERRLLMVEQVLRRQDAQLRLLQGKLESVSPVVPLRDRSRSPAPMLMPNPPVMKSEPAMVFQSLEEFLAVNNLDEKCAEVLRIQPADVQQMVVALGPVEGRNPSAMVMGRLAKCQSGAEASMSMVTSLMPPMLLGVPGACIGDQVEQFCMENALDENCANVLRGQPPECQAMVIGQGSASGRNASAMVMGRIGKYHKAGGTTVSVGVAPGMEMQMGQVMGGGGVGVGMDAMGAAAGMPMSFGMGMMMHPGISA